jgi:diadenosine tetraphosphate (Ap4A) HIT family hydrolase
MSPPAIDDHCLFCAVEEDPVDTLAWYDHPLYRRSDVGVAIAAVGAFTPGYVLVSPTTHVSSTQTLPMPDAALFLNFLDAVVSRVEARFGGCSIFEHGSCRAEERRRSACITHAHVHIVPGAYSFDSLGLPVKTYHELFEIMDLPRPERLDGYLMYREPGGLVSRCSDVGVSQYFRRHIAAVRGYPDEWDYALFPRWEHVRATQEALTSVNMPFLSQPEMI